MLTIILTTDRNGMEVMKSPADFDKYIRRSQGSTGHTASDL